MGGYEFEIIVDVSVYNVQFFEVGVNLPRSAAGKREGLLGNNDDNPNNDLKTRDGTVLDVNANDQDALYNQFIESWRVVADDAASKKRDEKDAGASNSLFLYNKGKTTETYTDRAHHENFLAVTSKPLSQTFGAAKVSEAEQSARRRPRQRQEEQQARSRQLCLGCIGLGRCGHCHAQRGKCGSAQGKRPQNRG